VLCVNALIALFVFCCSRCAVKLQTNFHRHNYAEPEPDNKPVQTGTSVFIKELKSRHFPRFVPFNSVVTVEQRFSNCGPRTTSGPRVLPLWSSD
jgi:hypothetical protein